jgi:hypothetical protein
MEGRERRRTITILCLIADELELTGRRKLGEQKSHSPSAIDWNGGITLLRQPLL